MLILVTSNHRQTIRSYGHLSMDLSNGQTIEQEETRQVTIVLTISYVFCIHNLDSYIPT